MVFLNYLHIVISDFVVPPYADLEPCSFLRPPHCILHDFKQHFNVHGRSRPVLYDWSTTWTSFCWIYDIAQDTIVLDLTMQFPFCPWLCQALWRLACTFCQVFLRTVFFLLDLQSEESNLVQSTVWYYVYILIKKMYFLNRKSLWIKASAKMHV